MSFEAIHYVNMLFGGGIIVLQILAVIAVFFLVFGSGENKFLSFLKNHFIEIGFAISLCAVGVSIFYSEIVGYLPCKHCWIQRIFLFPQAILFGVAWWRKDKNVLWYSLPLLLIGLLDAMYLIFIYYFRPNSAPCDASGVSCVQRLVSEFGGYITIPSLSISGFLILLVLLAVAYFYKKDNNPL